MNTLENKAKFFAQYWGVNCLKNELLNPELPPDEVYSGNCKGLPQQFLELTPLSQITDEDANTLAVILGGNNSGKCDKNVYGSSKWGGTSIKFKRHQFTFSCCLSNNGYAFNGYYERYGQQHFNPLTIEASDFLRSRGYALEFIGVSVTKQVEYGWIKLKE